MSPLGSASSWWLLVWQKYRSSCLTLCSSVCVCVCVRTLSSVFCFTHLWEYEEVAFEFLQWMCCRFLTAVGSDHPVVWWLQSEKQPVDFKNTHTHTHSGQWTPEEDQTTGTMVWFHTYSCNMCTHQKLGLCQCDFIHLDDSISLHIEVSFDMMEDVIIQHIFRGDLFRNILSLHSRSSRAQRVSSFSVQVILTLAQQQQHTLIQWCCFDCDFFLFALEKSGFF